MAACVEYVTTDNLRMIDGGAAVVIRSLVQFIIFRKN